MIIDVVEILRYYLRMPGPRRPGAEDMIYFNGQPVAGAEELRLTDLLKLVKREAGRVVVTVNGEFIAAYDYKRIIVRDGARVEAWELLNGG